MKLIMYSSYIFSKRLVSVHLLAMQVLFIHSVSSLNLTNEYLNHKCRVSEGKYQSGSMYEENFNFLIKTVSSYDLRNGFEHISYGEDPNTVAFIFGCRGDSYGSKCRQCYATAIAGLRRRCERNKGGIIWYDQCFLDVSTIDQRTPRKIDYKNAFSLHNPNNVNGDTKSFNKNTEDFLYNLVQKGNRSPGVGNEPIYYASGEKRLGTHKLYAMVQCAKDIALCKDCLGWSIKELSKCCYGKQGARVLSTTCNLRYEIYPFLRTEKTV